MQVKPVTVREDRGNRASVLSDQSLELPGDWDKLTQVRDTSKFLLPVGTSFVERDVLGIAEEVHRASGGRCRVASCSCGKCVEDGHYPHVVLEQGTSGRTYPVFGFTTFGPHVVTRLRQIHVSNRPEQVARENNKRIRAEQKKAFEARSREKLEIIQSALESRKFDWRGPEGVKTRA